MRYGVATAALALAALALTAAMAADAMAANAMVADAMAADAMVSDAMAADAMEAATNCTWVPMGILRQFTCRRQVLRVRNAALAEIDCQGSELDCALLPRVDVGRGGALQRLEVRRCALAGSLACALARLNATGAAQYAFMEPQTPLDARALEDTDTSVVTKLRIGAAGVQDFIPEALLASLPSLRQLAVAGGARLRLEARQFAAAPALRHLELSELRLQSLPADAFRGLPRLDTLVLYKAHIQEIHPDAFAGLEALETLSLVGHPLAALPRGLLAHTPNLKVLDLTRNFLKSLDEGVVSGLQHLEELNIENDVPLVLGARALSALPALRRLAVLRSDVPALPPDLLRGTVGLVNLTLEDNRIEFLPDDVFTGLSRLERLTLSGNNLTSLSARALDPLTAALEIHLDRNRLQSLPDGVFGRLGSLRALSLADNQLSALSELAFSGEVGASLRRLDLRHNRLAWDEGRTYFADNYYGYSPSSPLNPLDKLEELDLSHNQLRTVPSDLTGVMRWLRTLDLSHNNLTRLDISQVNFVSENVVVNYRNNRISFLEVNPASTSTATLLLAGNPFRCDCELYSFLKERALRPQRYEVGGARCAEPPGLRARPLPAVALRELTCQLPARGAPPACACLYRPSEPRAECACARVPPSLPDVARNVSRDPRLYVALTLTSGRDLPELTLPPIVKHLNLSGLGLRAVPRLPASLARVDLTDNELRAVPPELLARANLSLLLKGNPFECSCDARDDVANIIRNKWKIWDRDNLTCAGGSPLLRVDPGHLCDVYLAALVGGVLAGLGVLVALAAAVCYRYSLHIQVWVYKLGLKWIVSEETLDANKKYDIFLSYSDKDFDLVSKVILPKLEAKYKVCIHFRDWEVGRLVHDNIYRSVFESRRTVIVLTRNFLQSYYATVEFRAAYQHGLRDVRVRALLLLMEDIRDDEIHPEIKSFMSLTTYLKWEDSLFWDRLEKALPRKSLTANDLRDKKRAKMAVDSLAPVVGARGLVGDKGGEGGLRVVLNDEGKLVNQGFDDCK